MAPERSALAVGRGSVWLFATCAVMCAAGASAIVDAACGPVAIAWGVSCSTRTAAPPAPPSLLRPGLLDPASRVGANLSLSETLEALGGPLKPAASTALATQVPIDPEVRAKAIRLYVQGRAAALENQTLLAATKFDEALGLDPASPEILASYARLLSRLGNSAKANALYDRLLAIDPTRPEALLTLGLQSANRGEVEGTIRALAPLLIEPPPTEDGKASARALQEFWSSLRDDAVLAVELSLARALNESGADAALLEVLDRSFARTTPKLQAWPAVECRRIAGDARARAGDLRGALRDWSEALKKLEADEPSDIALPAIAARVIWAERAIAIEGDAQQGVAEPAMATLKRLIEQGAPREEWIALAAWLASTTTAGSPADDALRAFASSIEIRVGDPRSARLAAALAPARAFERLAASHDRRRPDRAHIAAWLAAAAEQSPQRALDLATTLLADDSTEPDQVISGLISCGLDAPTLLRLAASPANDPRRVALRVRLLARYERTGDAWRIGSEARTAKGDDPALIRALIVAATAAKRAEAVPDLAARVRADDVAGQIDVLRAWVSLGETEKAREVSEQVESAARDNERVRAIARGLRASAMAADAARARDREKVNDALDALRVAVAADRTYELGWSQLLSITRVLHPPDPRKGPSDEEKALRKELFEALPDSTLAFTLARETLIGQGRSGDALEALVARAASAPWEESLLRDAIGVLASAGRVAESLAILDERIAAAPADPLAWQLWTEATIAAGHAEEALERLSRDEDRAGDQAPEEGGFDPIPDRLRALPLRALGRTEEADAAEEAELNRQAPSVRRDIARIAKFIDAGNDGEALSRLRVLAERRSDLTAQESFAGLELSIRVAASPDRDGLVRGFAEDLLARAERPETAGGMEPAAIVRAAGALALVSRGEDQAAARATLATRAVAAQAKAASAMDPQAASVWLDLAQRFADERKFAEGSDFLGSIARSEIRMAPAVAARLATACFALDAAAGGRAAKSIALLDLVRSRGIRPFAGRQRAVERDSDELYLLAGVYSLIDDWKGNREILAESLARDPKHAMSLNNLAWDRLERDAKTPQDIAEIATMIESAHAALPDDASILDSIGWLRYKQGKFADAVDLLGRAVTAGGDDPSLEVLDHFGDAVWRNGNRDAAKNAWREVQASGARSFGREAIVGRLPTYETNEHGIRVLDAEALWKRSYGDVIDRAAAKVKAIDEGRAPPVAPAFGTDGGSAASTDPPKTETK